MGTNNQLTIKEIYELQEQQKIRRLQELMDLQTVIIDDSNTLYPHECSKKDLKVLLFQDNLIKYNNKLDSYKKYTDVIVYGCDTIKQIKTFVSNIWL